MPKHRDPIYELAVGDRVQLNALSETFGVIREIFQKDAYVDWEDGRQFWTALRNVFAAPTTEDIYGVLTVAFQREWTPVVEQRHRGVFAHDDNSYCLPHAHAVCLRGRERVYEVE